MANEDQFGRGNFGGPSSGSSEESYYSLGQYIGGPYQTTSEEELLTPQRVFTINLLPFPQRQYELYKLSTTLLDYIILTWHTRTIMIIEDAYNPEGTFFDNSFIFDYLGQPKFLDLGFTEDAKKSLAAMISSLYNLKGTKRGLSLLLKLLNIDGTIYEWQTVNSGVGTREDGTEIYFSSKIDRGNVIVQFDLNDVPNFDFTNDEKLQFLKDFMLFICTEIEEFRWEFLQKEQFRNNPNQSAPVIAYDTGDQEFNITSLDPEDGVFAWEEWTGVTGYLIGDIVLAPISAINYAGKYVKAVVNHTSEATFNPTEAAKWKDLEDLGYFAPYWLPSTLYPVGTRATIPSTVTDTEAIKYIGREIEAITDPDHTSGLTFNLDDWRVLRVAEEAKVYATVAENYFPSFNPQVLDIFFPEMFGDFLPEGVDPYYEDLFLPQIWNVLGLTNSMGFLSEEIRLGPTLGNVIADSLLHNESWVLGEAVHVNGNLSALNVTWYTSTIYYIGIPNTGEISFHVEKQDALDGVNPITFTGVGLDTDMVIVYRANGKTEEIELFGNVDDANNQIISSIDWRVGDHVFITGDVESLDPALEENTLYYIGIDTGEISFHANSTDALANVLGTRIVITDGSIAGDKIKIFTVYGLTFQSINKYGFGVKGSLSSNGTILDNDIHPDDYEINYNGIPFEFVRQYGSYLDTPAESVTKATLKYGRNTDREEIITFSSLG